MNKTNEMNENTRKIVKVILIIIVGTGVAMILFFGFSSAYFAWTEWQLRENLKKEGILTKAIMYECSGRRMCDATYKFSIVADGQLKKYQGEDRIRCYQCPLTQITEIRYMPQNPNISGLEGRSTVSFWVKMALAMLLLYPTIWFINEAKTIWAKSKGLLRKFYANKKE